MTARLLLGMILAALAARPPALPAYPLDGYEETGIRRLEAMRLAHEGIIEGPRQPPGALLPTDMITLGLQGIERALPPPPDAGFTRDIRELLGEQADRYSLLVLDLTDLDQPRFAAHRGGEKQNVGSVGKLLAAHGLFAALAAAWPDDIAQRKRILRDTVVVADEFSVSDHHTIRLFDVPHRTLVRRPMQIGDAGSLWEQLDWMLSVSSNSAASMVMREAMLIRAWGQDYPAPDAARRAFFATTPAGELTRLFQQTFWAPIARAGLDLEQIRQGSFFTKGGQRMVQGGGLSYATADALLEWLLLMERGSLVDPWSSLQIKRLLYVTERRIRYASSPALDDAAVYSKSGSLWGCTPEPGFECRPYHGNLRNWMNSVSVIEENVADVRIHYLVVLISNVLRENSAVTHQTIGTRVHQLIRAHHGVRSEPHR